VRAGSKSATSWAIGKLNVWSDARGSGEGAGLPVGLQAAIAMARRISRALKRTRRRLTSDAMLCLVSAARSRHRCLQTSRIPALDKRGWTQRGETGVL